MKPMSRKIKLYVIKVPFSVSELRRGSRYILTKLTTNDVQIVYHRTKKNEKVLITETHKVIDARKKIPYILKKVIPEDACVVDEFSTNIDSIAFEIKDSTKREVYNIDTQMQNKDGIVAELDVHRTEIISENPKTSDDADANSEDKKNSKESEININILNINEDQENLDSCTTTYKNRHFDKSTFSMTIKTKLRTEFIENIFKVEKDYKTEIIDFRSYNKANLNKVGDRDYSGNWEEKYKSTYVYKLIDIDVNRFGFGWISGEIDKHVRNMLVDVQQKIIETYDEWKNLTEEEIVNMEKEMIQRFLRTI